MKNSVVFYQSFYEAIKNIPPEEQLKLYNAIFEYSFTENEIKLEDGIAKAMFILMKPNIDSANARYNASVENGKLGGRPKSEPKNNLEITQTKPNNNLDITQDITQTKPNNNLNVDVDVDDDVDGDVDVESKLQQKFIKCLNSFNTNSIETCISYLNDLPYEVIEQALEKTASINKPSWKYCKTILDSWIKKGIDTIEKVEAEKNEYKENPNKKEKFNITPEEQYQKMVKILGGKE